MLNDHVIDLSKMTKSEISNLRGTQGFICLCCKKPAIFKNGTRKKAHFSHEGEEVKIGSAESAAHMLVKHTIAKWLKKQNIVADVERRFVNIERIADVYFEFDGRRYVVEVQKSPMSDGEFYERVSDYQVVDATVIWVFLGDLFRRKNIFKLPSVMHGRDVDRLLHFCVKSARLTIFENPVFVTTQAVFSNAVSKRMDDVTVVEFVKKPVENIFFDKSWLDIRLKFRIKSYHLVSKSEKKLLEQCLIRGFNLSMLPVEIGWPVAGVSFMKNLFVWQAYVLLTIVKYMTIGEKFAIDKLMKLLEFEYDVSHSLSVASQVCEYLQWLVMFNVLTCDGAVYTYVSIPQQKLKTEELMTLDKLYVDTVAKLWKRW